MTCYMTGYLFSVRTYDPLFRTDDLFPNRISILRTKYILQTDSSNPTELFIRCTNDSPQYWLPVRMTPQTNDSTFRIYLRRPGPEQIIYPPYEQMICSGTEYLFSVRTDDPLSETDDLVLNRIFILHKKYILGTDSLHPTGLFIPRMNDSPYNWILI